MVCAMLIIVTTLMERWIWYLECFYEPSSVYQVNLLLIQFFVYVDDNFSFERAEADKFHARLSHCLPSQQARLLNLILVYHMKARSRNLVPLYVLLGSRWTLMPWLSPYLMTLAPNSCLMSPISLTLTTQIVAELSASSKLLPAMPTGSSMSTLSDDLVCAHYTLKLPASPKLMPAFT